MHTQIIHNKIRDLFFAILGLIGKATNADLNFKMYKIKKSVSFPITLIDRILYSR